MITKEKMRMAAQAHESPKKPGPKIKIKQYRNKIRKVGYNNNNVHFIYKNYVSICTARYTNL